MITETFCHMANAEALVALTESAIENAAEEVSDGLADAGTASVLYGAATALRHCRELLGAAMLHEGLQEQEQDSEA